MYDDRLATPRGALPPITAIIGTAIAALDGERARRAAFHGPEDPR
jgi:hypothetical protein